ncbi:MAG: endonuclease MutS2 [Syntrophomonadaceae bacterium]|nr:endonuclease MutS2 [Syntrophomonadaceae bacterium]
MFNQKTLDKLEFNKVIARLKDCCASALGVEKALALTPGSRLTEVTEALSKTTEARDFLRREPSLPLGGIFDIRGHLWKAEKGGVLEPAELNQVASTLRASRRLKKLLTGEPPNPGRTARTGIGPFLAALAGQLGSFPQLEESVAAAIDEEGEIKDTASPELRRLRRQINQLQLGIKEKLEQIVRQPELQKILQEPIVTIRRDRYVVPIKRECQHQFAGIVHDHSASGATAFMEPMAVVRMNNELRRLEAEEEREVERILRELTLLVRSVAAEAGQTLEALAELDFCFAKGRLSLLMNGGEPEINTGGWVNLVQARHPLIPGRVVPISIHLGKDYQILIITGPNTGGKTVTLKTVGLLCLMAQAGLHLPAEHGTSLPIFREVFVDLGDEQSIEQSLSTFSSHMTNIIEILGQADRDSLVLLDELGAGTDPTEGAALGMALIEHLLSRGIKAIATTHYSELKVFAYKREGVENAAVEFDPETLMPTYRLRIGLPGRSNAFEIASRLGLDPQIVENARQFLTREELQVADLLQNLKESHLKTEEERRRAELLSRNAQNLEAELKRRQQDWKEKEGRLLRQAQEEAVEIVRRARLEADGIIKQLRQLAKSEPGPREVERAAASAREQLSKLQGRHYQEWQQAPQLLSPGRADFKPGDAVFIPRLNQKGQVLSDPSPSGEVQVQVGILRLNLSQSELMPSPQQEKATPASSPAVGKLMAEKSRAISREVHLRGMLVDEALNELEKYLDDAYLAGLTPVYVVHGKGTGTLRTAVRQYLSDHPWVLGFRPAEAHEGGLGATVVELKV